MVDARRQAQGDPLLRPLRPRLRDPRDARPAAALVPDPHLQRREVRPSREASAGRACCSTSSAAPGPCVGGDRATSDYRRLVEDLMAFLDGETEPVIDRLEAEMQRGLGRRSSSSRRRAFATSSSRSASPSRAPGDGRRHAPRTSTSSAIAEDELEAAVQVLTSAGAGSSVVTGFILEKVETARAPPSSSRRCSRATTPRRRSAFPDEVLVPELPDERRRDVRRAWLTRAPRARRSRIRVPQRGPQARAAATVARPQREPSSSPATACGEPRPHVARPRPRRAAAATSGSRSRRCASSATT